MARIGQDDGMQTFTAGQNFAFSGARIERLGATEYTLVQVDFDTTGSINGFERAIEDAAMSIVEACRKSPRAENLLFRPVLFDTSGGIREVHGFKPLADIDIAAYKGMVRAGGMTNLYDAVYHGVSSVEAYAAQLFAQDYLCNAIQVTVTDGCNNQSTATPRMIADRIAKMRKGEQVESYLSILVGINAGMYLQQLETFKNEADIDQYVDVGEATPRKLAKLAEFVSRSISSQSQALGTGGPSKPISATF